MIPLPSRKRGRWSYLFFRGKITIYKFTPQVFTLTRNLHLHSKGFFPEIEVQDFPIRGKAVYLRVKCRRWEDPETGQYLRLL